MRTFSRYMAVTGFVGFVGLLAAPAAQAAPVTFMFNVKIDAVQDANNDLFGGGLHAGDVVQGFLVYDSATPDQKPDDPIWAVYGMQGGISAFGLHTPLVTPDTFQASGFTTYVGDFPGVDVFTVRSFVPFNFNGFLGGEARLNVQDHSATWFTGDALPTALSLAQLAAFDTEFVFDAQKLGVQHFLRGHLTLDAPTGPRDPETPPAVPEPTTLTLLGTGLLGLVRMHRRRTHASRD